MVLNPAFLRDTVAARERLRAAEAGLEAVRSDFERSVRRLYVDGGSTREIAEALGLSHQRVHQLIGSKPQSWWQRLTGTMREPSRGCSFCGKQPDAVRKLVAGPCVQICDGCVAEALVALDQAAADRAAGRFALVPPLSRQRCSFCGQRDRATPRVTASGHQICPSCAGLAQRIIAGERIT